MAAKPKLYYFNGRVRMESVRWLLAAPGVEFDEEFVETREHYPDGYLLFQQVPMVEIDGQKLVQTRAILHYIAGKYNLYGNSLMERAYLLEAILMVEELHKDIFSSFPQVQAFKERISQIPTIKNFLHPGSQRKPRKTMKTVLNMS
ncbi:glutathione S-transferase 3-like [Discoglossus pictus]